MKYLLTVLITFTLSCHNPPTLETRVKEYMKDSVVPRFNDPSTYEYVSMEVDTFRGRNYVQNIREIYKDTTLGKEYFDMHNREADSLSLNSKYMDSIFHIEVKVNFRGKNKMGALILDNINLRYFPSLNKFLE